MAMPDHQARTCPSLTSCQPALPPLRYASARPGADSAETARLYERAKPRLSAALAYRRRSTLAIALLGLCAASLSPGVAADPQEAGRSTETGTQEDDADQKPAAKRLETITVTGTLIPQVEVETAAPLIIISGDALQARGFGTVAEALRQSSIATGIPRRSRRLDGFIEAPE